MLNNTENSNPPNAAQIAQGLAAILQSQGVEYALGGALALGFWANPRGTIDVDLTLFLPRSQPMECVWLLQEIGCELTPSKVVQSLREHDFCSVMFGGARLDVFLPNVDFYEAARRRRKQVDLGGQAVMVWDAESLAVFKLMFFRRKDLADVEQILQTQGASFDRDWVRGQLAAMYAENDPRLSAWDELVRDVPALLK